MWHRLPHLMHACILKLNLGQAHYEVCWVLWLTMYVAGHVVRHKYTRADFVSIAHTRDVHLHASLVPSSEQEVNNRPKAQTTLT
jgi:hypothetical protein